MKRALVGVSFVIAVLGASSIGIPVDRATREVSRLRAHFDSVDGELRTADMAHLSPAQQASRAQLIEWLRDYRDAGSFPVNDRFPDRMAPFFRDSRGVLCAIAWLIARSGRTDIVDAVAATRNNAYIAQLADDPVLVRWLDSVGLTVEEAARIQPSYGGSSSVNTDYALKSIGVSGAGLVLSTLNITAPSEGTGFFGVIAGAGAMALGFTELKNGDGDNHDVAVVNTVIGAVSLGLGVRGIIVGNRKDKEKAGQERALSLVPLVTTQDRKPAFGVVLGARF